eukprot:5039329-Pleurochrysis_carterae.AAC.1
MPLVFALNRHISTRFKDGIKWPTNFTLWRGGGLPAEHRQFFVPGKCYRVPMFLSTSDSRAKAETFLRRGVPHFVLWKINLDPTEKCKHVNFIDRHDGMLDSDPNSSPEAEFLFAPYSVFTVESVKWQAKPSKSNPHLVVISAAVDNRGKDEQLPLAPWA